MDGPGLGGIGGSPGSAVQPPLAPSYDDAGRGAATMAPLLRYGVPVARPALAPPGTARGGTAELWSRTRASALLPREPPVAPAEATVSPAGRAAVELLPPLDDRWTDRGVATRKCITFASIVVGALLFIGGVVWVATRECQNGGRNSCE
jgi:hypothetical protein